MTSSVEFYEDTKSEWRWRIKAANGEIVAESGESYQRKTDAEHGFDVAMDADERGKPGPGQESLGVGEGP